MRKQTVFIDKDNLESLLSYQCTKDDIAGFFHCSHDSIERFCKKTYKKTFSEVADEYRAEGRASLRRTQFAMAQSNVQMAIHLGKQYLGQTDKTESKVSAEATVKRGDVTRVIYYDPATGNPTQETIQGADDDVRAYLQNHADYNGDTLTLRMPNEGLDPDTEPEYLEDKVTGERTLTSPDGQVRLHMPYNGRDDKWKQFVLRDGKTGAQIEFPDDGRGGYGHAILDDYDDGRGGYL